MMRDYCHNIFPYAGDDFQIIQQEILMMRDCSNDIFPCAGDDLQINYLIRDSDDASLL